jgi:hypothetical protein
VGFQRFQPLKNTTPKSMWEQPHQTGFGISLLFFRIGIESAYTISRNSILELLNPKSPSENHRSSNPMQRRNYPFILLSLLIVFWARVPNVHSQQMHIVDPQINQNIDSLLTRMRAPAADIYAGPKKVPLKEALARWDVRVLFDERAFEEEAISVDELVEAPFHGQSMLSYLELNGASPLNLTWVPHEGGITITTKSNSANVLCAWDISRLSKTKSDRSRRADPWYDSIARQCITIIQQTVENDNWDIGGGTSTLLELQINNKTILVASAPFETNMKIHDLLNSLDAISNLPATRNRTANPTYSQRSLQESRQRAPRSSRQRR